MDFKDAQQIVSKIKYRDINIKLTKHSLNEICNDLAILTFSRDVNDAYDSDKIISLKTTTIIDCVKEDEYKLIKSIHKWLRQMETHECDEWFEYSGKKIFDPHKR